MLQINQQTQRFKAQMSTMQAKGTTDAVQASSLLTTANQLSENVRPTMSVLLRKTFMLRPMNALTGDTIDNLSTPRDNSNLLTLSNTLNDAVNRAIKAGNAFGSDRAAQKTLAGFADCESNCELLLWLIH
jgi:Neuraminidase (sialidase)